MPYNTQKLLTDIDGRPIPQYYDPVTDKFYPVGTMNVDVADRAARALGKVSADAGAIADLAKAMPVDGQNVLASIAVQALVKALRNGDLTKEELLEALNGALFVNPRTSAGAELFTAVTPGAVTLHGSFDTFRTPVTGVKTVTATAAEIFAGASRLNGRRKMILKNEDPVLRFRIGPSSVTQQNGFPVEPGSVLELTFDPNVSVPVYAISEGTNLQVAVMEL